VWISGGEFVEPLSSGSSPSPGTCRDLGPTSTGKHRVAARDDALLRQLLTESRADWIELQHSGALEAGGAIDGNTRDAPGFGAARRQNPIAMRFLH